MVRAGNGCRPVKADSFRKQDRTVKLHGHCHQKALASQVPTVRMLELVPGQKVSVIPSGCRGIAGAFGYESEHFGVSNVVGELILFPVLRNSASDTVIAAPGTSCRHQIRDGTGRKALHSIQIMRESLA